MIIGTNFKREIGHRGYSLSDHKKKIHNQPLVVIREATKEEWKQDLMSKGLSRSYVDSIETPPDAYYYEVSID